MQILMIIAKENYRDEEYTIPKKIFEDAGYTVITASKKTGLCKGKLGGSATATVALADVDVSDYAAVVFVGGSGATQYQQDVQAHLTAQEARTQSKLVAAICIGPTILAYAGVLENVHATVWNGDGEQSTILENQGAIYQNKAVVVDGKIITANGPEAAEEFARKIVKLLRK